MYGRTAFFGQEREAKAIHEAGEINLCMAGQVFPGGSGEQKPYMNQEKLIHVWPDSVFRAGAGSESHT